MIRRIIGALCCGILVTLFFAQYDPWVKEQVGNQFKQIFEQTLRCTFTGTVTHVNFFRPSITFNKVRVSPPNKQDHSWQWTCKEYSTFCSWIDLILYGFIGFSLTLDQPSITSQMKDNQCAIEPHIKAILEKPNLPIPVFLKSITLNCAQLSIHDTEHDTHVTCSWTSFSKQIADCLRTSLYIKDGSAFYKGMSIFEHMQGVASTEVYEHPHGIQTIVTIDNQFDIPRLQSQTLCFLSGSWNTDHGRFSLHNADHSISFEPLIITKQATGETSFTLNGRIPANVIAHAIDHNYADYITAGDVTLSMRGNYQNTISLDGHISGNHVTLTGLTTPLSARLICQKRDHIWRSTTNITNGDMALHAELIYNQERNKGKFTITNPTSLYHDKDSYWHIPPYEFTVSARYAKKELTGTYNTNIKHRLHNAHHTVAGTLATENTKIHIDGTINDQRYNLHADLATYPYLISGEYLSAQNRQLLAFASKNNSSEYVGSIHIPFIRSLINAQYGSELQADGDLVIDAILDEKNKTINGSINLIDGVARIGQTYNFIDGFSTKYHYDIAQRLLTARDITCHLHSGHAYCNKAVCMFDNAWNITWLHIPLTINRCLITVEQDLFAIISGYLLCTKRESASSINGFITIDQSQLKENIFSMALQKKMLHNRPAQDTWWRSIACNLSLYTKEFMHIDTLFLEADAQANLHIDHTLGEPSLTGSIILPSGSLFFPYKPLTIMNASIIFNPGRIDDPDIFVLAKNKIKKYTVTLQAQGPLSQPQLMLDAIPALSQEQVVSLLFVGSEEQLLNTMIPALIFQNIKGMLFGAHHISLFERYLKPKGRPFSINLVPSFVDQTGRGGLRAAVEIEIGDRWRALIQKNFSLTEDTRFELEYFLSDDISIRGIRNERSDFGGEVEMKWKF